MAIITQNFDQINGWDATKPGWHEYNISINDLTAMSETYEEVLAWLYNRIDNCERHARWMVTRSCIYLKFRYERDVILCKLSF